MELGCESNGIIKTVLGQTSYKVCALFSDWERVQESIVLFWIGCCQKKRGDYKIILIILSRSWEGPGIAVSKKVAVTYVSWERRRFGHSCLAMLLFSSLLKHNHGLFLFHGGLILVSV